MAENYAKGSSKIDDAYKKTRGSNLIDTYCEVAKLVTTVQCVQVEKKLTEYVHILSIQFNQLVSTSSKRGK